MTLASLSPQWFYGYDIILELGFAIITSIIAFIAFRIYKTTDQRQVLIFGTGFSLISFSYFLQSLLNFLITTQAGTAICGALNISYGSLLDVYGTAAHILFMTAGLSLLTYMTFKAERVRIFWLLLGVALVGIFSSTSPLYTFFLISTILLAIILWHFIANYRQTLQVATLLVVIAFGFLLFGSLHFMLSVNHEVYYVIGHILELVAYVLILLNLYLVLRNGKKA